MKFLTSFLCVFSLFSIAIQAQNLTTCGTPDEAIDIEYLIKNKSKLDKYRNSEVDYVIPIQFHAVAKDNGTGRFSKAEVIQLVCDINEDFAPYNMKFYIYQNTINNIDNTDYYNHPEFSGGYEMMDEFNVSGVVNVYIVNDPAGNCGYFSPGGNAVAIAKSCANPGESTLSHELGHFFSLPHTFYGWEYNENLPENQQEKVARSGPSKNCHYTADTFCDTPPDYAPYRWSCPHDTQYDPDGVAFTPDSSFYMSYALDACQSRFSEEQVAAMKFNIDNDRSYLLNHNTTLAEIEDYVTPTMQVYPANEATVGQNITLQWQAAENATHYALKVTNYLSDISLDIIVEGNSYELQNLESGSYTFWKVAPYHLGYYCAGATSLQRFWVSDEVQFSLSDYQVTPPTCNDSNDASITIEVSGGVEPYNFVWEDGTEGNSIYDIGDGNHTVTVTDSNGYSEDIEIQIDAPTNINTDLEVTLESTTATVTGGVAPYTFIWNNSDENTETVYDLPAGENELYIIDYYNCSDTTTFNIITADVTSNNVLCHGENTGSIVINEVLGISDNFDVLWSNGSTNLAIYELEAGNYTLTITPEEGNQLVQSYTITEPEEELSLNYTQFNNNITVIPEGGTPPYFVTWSNGEAGESITDLASGTYTAFIEDANVCTTQFSFNVTSINVEALEASTVSLFLSDNNNILNVSINETAKTNIQMKVYDVAGKLVNAYTLNNELQLNIENLANGLYFSQFIIDNQTAATIKWMK